MQPDCVVSEICSLIRSLDHLGVDDKVEAINTIRDVIHAMDRRTPLPPPYPAQSGEGLENA
jgi:hypothetical protein